MTGVIQNCANPWRNDAFYPSPLRPTDVMCGRADPAKAARLLGWKAQFHMPEVARTMVEAELASGCA